MLRGSTDLKGNFQGSLKELQLRRICVPAEHRRPFGRIYRVRHPLTEIRHVSFECQVPVRFLPSRHQSCCCRKLCTCLWMCFLNSLLILFFMFGALFQVRLSHCCSSHSFRSHFPFISFSIEDPPHYCTSAPLPSSLQLTHF